MPTAAGIEPLTSCLRNPAIYQLVDGLFLSPNPSFFLSPCASAFNALILSLLLPSFFFFFSLPLITFPQHLSPGFSIIPCSILSPPESH
ncbi:hypothetical protein RIF29_29876 [Crotalaria pallida]|uniref:Uncharacterized protein n=1 Tax=Crotalaria pallida TaxID=3830 RepID=A0AAN9EHG4_CROPI